MTREEIEKALNEALGGKSFGSTTLTVGGQEYIVELALSGDYICKYPNGQWMEEFSGGPAIYSTIKEVAGFMLNDDIPDSLKKKSNSTADKKEDKDMTVPKAQERKALAQIRKIVEGLGEDSYIGTAFEGCFEIAEENIENDFGCSMKQRAEEAEKKCKTLEEESAEFNRIAGRNKDELDEAKQLLTTARKALDDKDEIMEANRKTIADLKWELQEEKAARIKGEEAMAAAEREIIELKAKLYDAMMGKLLPENSPKRGEEQATEQIAE